MIRKNVELELQALVLLQYQLGIIRSSDGLNSGTNTNDDEIMAIVMKKSKDEYDLLMKSRNAASSSRTELPVRREQDLETAKKLVKSERLVDGLKNELSQQEEINRKIVRDELRNPKFV